MRLFQIGHIYPAHCQQLAPSLARLESYADAHALLVDDVPKSHILKPCLTGEADAFLSFHREPISLRLWADERGLPKGTTSDDILLAQIEDHRAEILYNVHASEMSHNLIRRLPGCVRLKIAWLGSPIVGDGFPSFNAVVSNFPQINAEHKTKGLRTTYFFPSYDPSVDSIKTDLTRDIDVLFIGGYSRHHRRRAKLLNLLAQASNSFNFALHLSNSRYTRLAETPFGWFPPLSAVRRPKNVRDVARGPLFGRSLFEAIMRSKIVVNMAIDMAGADRGNIRCFETLSAGALLVSDDGDYPLGFKDGVNMILFRDSEDAIRKIRALLADAQRGESISSAGRNMVQALYSKERQWRSFQELCTRLY